MTELDTGGIVERLQRLAWLLEEQEPMSADARSLAEAAGEAARAARELAELPSGYNPAPVAEAQTAELLPLNRKERFYTGTVLPLVIAADGFAYLDRFLALCGITDVVTSPQRDGTAPCQLITEYNFTESLTGATDGRWQPKTRSGDTPDVVLVAQDFLIAVEAKLFDRPTRAELELQIARQRELVDEWADVLAINNDRVRHIALLPDQFAREVGAVAGADIITWQRIAEAYRVVGPAYWVGVLDFACSSWSKLASKPRTFGQNADARLTGEAVVALVDQEIVEYGYVGRIGDATGTVRVDAATGAWRTRLYEVRRDPLPGNPQLDDRRGVRRCRPSRELISAHKTEQLDGSCRSLVAPECPSRSRHSRQYVGVYGVPADLDLEPLVGRSLINIVLGTYNTMFSFDDSGGVNADGRWEVRDAEGTILGGRSRGEPSEMDLADVPFSLLLGATVKSTSTTPPSYFELALSNGVSLRFYDDSDDYESVTVHPGDYVI